MSRSSARPGCAEGADAVGASGDIATAILTTFVGYRRQLQLALTPAASGTLRAARIQSAIARLVTGRDPMARSISDFMLTTIARNRAQQAPIP